MRADVKALIGTLTMERNALNRAIAALEATGTTDRAPEARPTVTRRRRTRSVISNEVKASISGLMSTADNKWRTAQSLGREFAISPTTIYTGWPRWSRLFPAVNGDVPPAEQIQ